MERYKEIERSIIKKFRKEIFSKFVKGASDYELINVCRRVLEKRIEKDVNVIIGTIATADIFCSDPEDARKAREEFEADCVEMEGASVAQVCYLDKVPFLVIRGISDTPDGENEMEYEYPSGPCFTSEITNSKSINDNFSFFKSL